VRGRKPTGEWATWYSEFLESGAATGFRDSYANIEKRARALEAEIHGKGIRNRAGIRQIADLLSDYNTAIENATRLSAYVVARKQGLSTIRAANIAKGLTVNFNRRGASSGAIADLYVFFNAAVQSTARMLQTLRSPAGKRIVAAGIGLGILQAVAGALMLGDDEWDELPEHEKAKNLIFPFPGADGKNYFKLPMPLGFNLFPNIGRSVTEMAMNQNRMGERAGNLLAAIMDSFNPLGYTGFDAAGGLEQFGMRNS
jgi:hypothetical protein